MLTKTCLSREYLLNIAKKYQVNPMFLTSNIASLFLVEALKQQKLSFVLRGGQAMNLLLHEPMRLSTDVDIIVAPNMEMGDIVEHIGATFPFQRYEEERREFYKGIPKKHYKFWYESPLDQSMQFISLDIVFESMDTSNYVEHSMQSIFTESDGEDVIVLVPDLNRQLGEKLTIIGNPRLRADLDPIIGYKVIKQIYDCATLFKEITSFSDVRSFFEMEAKKQLKYYKLSLSVEEMLLSMFQTCMCIMLRGTIAGREYQQYLPGIYEITKYTLSKQPPIEEAAGCAGIVSYIAACMLMPEDDCIDVNSSDCETKMSIVDFEKLEYIKEYSPDIYVYIVRAFQKIEKYIANKKN